MRRGQRAWPAVRPNVYQGHVASVIACLDTASIEGGHLLGRRSLLKMGHPNCYSAFNEREAFLKLDRRLQAYPGTTGGLVLLYEYDPIFFQSLLQPTMCLGGSKNLIPCSFNSFDRRKANRRSFGQIGLAHTNQRSSRPYLTSENHYQSAK